ncbi:MAG: Holliday junction resolvase RuvX [Candidatus Saccharibacteria bacterium]|nr:Holliday junction resolvase RuvX [Candidatus Saccharibacteria bacterium]
MRVIALDVGTKRIGVAFADSKVRIAIPRGMIPVDGNEFAAIAKTYRLEKAELIVAGLPRNSKGEETQQTQLVREFIEKLKNYFAEQMQVELVVRFQDESLTSVMAESYLGKEVSRADRVAGKVDTEAAAIILQDFLESTNFDQLEKEIHGAQ